MDTRRVSRCANCNADLRDQTGTYQEFITLSGQTERTVGLTQAITTVFEAAISAKQVRFSTNHHQPRNYAATALPFTIDHNHNRKFYLKKSLDFRLKDKRSRYSCHMFNFFLSQKIVPSESHIEICIPCISVLAELFRYYTEFLEMTQGDSYIRSLIEDSVVWQQSQPSSSSTTALRDPATMDFDLDSNFDAHGNINHSEVTEDVKCVPEEYEPQPHHIEADVDIDIKAEVSDETSIVSVNEPHDFQNNGGLSVPIPSASSNMTTGVRNGDSRSFIF